MDGEREVVERDLARVGVAQVNMYIPGECRDIKPGVMSFLPLHLDAKK